MIAAPCRVLLGCFVAGVAAAVACAQTPAPTPAPKRLPPVGIALPEMDRKELEVGSAALGREIEGLRSELKNKPALQTLLPDVEIYHKAVAWALADNQFYNVKEIATARALLAKGSERAQALRSGSAPWTTQTGPVVRGYRSRIDDSVQPYGIVVPASYQTGESAKRRLDFFLHGRGETLTELSFINGRQNGPGEFTPNDAFVLHPYGRFCNANRFAGETDLFEALDHAKSHYPVDNDRIVVRGFSMGGASAWQFGTHYAGLWAGVAPGAGFTDTPSYTNAFKQGNTPPPWYEQKLWHWYDPVAYAVNLSQTTTVAYSGEDDKQKAAADNMAKALTAERLELTHVIGPKTGHKYHPDSKVEINRRLDEAALRGRSALPRTLRFTTWTLRYNKMAWLNVDALDKHWDRARVDAELVGDDKITLSTQNVAALSLSLPSTRRAVIDGKDAGKGSHFVKTARGAWAAAVADTKTLRKRHGLQGPIDDAFTDRFVFVRPTGTPMNETVGAWTQTMMTKAVSDWRLFFRGDARVKDDHAINVDDLAGSNLVLWGDPHSNAVLSKIAGRLPVQWLASGVRVGDKLYPVGSHVPVLIFPNPLNPKRYVVVNSGFTFRDFMAASNAQHAPKLPDWAVLNTAAPGPPSLKTPGYVVDAGFFDETWKINRDKDK